MANLADNVIALTAKVDALTAKIDALAPNAPVDLSGVIAAIADMKASLKADVEPSA